MTAVRQRKRAALYTLGCRLNQSETAILRERLVAADYDIVPFDAPADLGIVNTCTVTCDADAKSRKAVRGFIRRNPDAYVAVIGCYSQMGYQALTEIEGVNLILGTQEKLNVLDYARQGKSPQPIVVRDNILRDDFTIEAAPGKLDAHRANLKIQDGCDFMCSFCVIPFARGRARSREFGDLLKEARERVAQGAKEVVLTGVNIGTYAHEGRTLVDVVDALNGIEGLARIRISSIEPTTVHDELFDRMNDPEHTLVPHLHLPVQSGSDRVLQLMRRRYTRSEVMDFAIAAAGKVPDICIGTDVLVGMPGEADEDFEDTCSLIEEAPFAYAHVFKYSERDGTASLRLPDPVSARVKDLRSARIRCISAGKLAEFHAKFAQSAMPVLFERREGAFWPGYTGNYIRVAVRSNDILDNELREVTLGESCGDFMTGVVSGVEQVEVRA